MKVINTVKVPMYVMVDDVLSVMDPKAKSYRCLWYLRFCREIIKTMAIVMVTLLLVWFVS